MKKSHPLKYVAIVSIQVLYLQLFCLSSSQQLASAFLPLSGRVTTFGTTSKRGTCKDAKVRQNRDWQRLTLNQDTDEYNMPKKRQKRKIIIATIISFITSRGFTPSAIAKVQQQQIPDIVTPVEIRIGDVRSRKPSVGIKVVSGAIVLGGYALTQGNKDNDSKDENKKQFKKIMATEDGRKDAESKNIIINELKADDEHGSRSEEIEKNDSAQQPLDEEVTEKVEVEKEIEMKKTDAQASAVAKTIAEATERAKKAEEKAKEEAGAKVKQEVEIKARQVAEAKAKQEAEAKAKEEAEVKAKEEAEVKARQEAEAKAMSLEESAFYMLLDLGMIEISPDPDCPTYDNSFDNEFVVS